MKIPCTECQGTGKVIFTRERGGPVCNNCAGAGFLSEELIQRHIAAILDGSSVYMSGPSQGSMRMAARIVEYLAGEWQTAPKV